ncbi:hypothetical protein SUGI_0229010 [Cryptomeria japonica]|nr:hypothetical protein SUGI_0229010 [Cryptomeria japonica]
MVKGGWSAGKSMVNLQEDADLPASTVSSIPAATAPGFPAIHAPVVQVGSNCSSPASRLPISIGSNNDNNVNCSLPLRYCDQSELDKILSSETLCGLSDSSGFCLRMCELLEVISPAARLQFAGSSTLTPEHAVPPFYTNAVSGVIQSLSFPGFVGFGKEPLSFVSQTATLYDSTFSYCFPSLFSSAFTGSLLLGKGAVSASGLKFTPLLSNARYPYFYYVGLNGISVGDELVSIPEGTLTLDESMGRGTIIDSGTVITRLVEPAYNAMRDSFRRRFLV